MKKILSTLFFSCLVVNAHAQQWSIGARLGSSYWLRKYDNLLTEKVVVGGKKVSADRSIFLRYETKGRIAYELGMSHSQLKYQYTPQIDDGPNWSYRNLSFTDNYTSLDVSFQVDITCRHLQACPVLKKFKTYLGVTLSPGFLSQTATAPATEFSEEVKMHNKDFEIWTSVNNTICYEVNKSFYITSVINFQVNPDELRFGSFSNTGTFFEPRTYARFGFRLGAAYKFH